MIGDMSIPLFPLDAVLFSGGYLSLRIFEPRYLKMVRQCEKSGSGFGVVLIHNGLEVHQEDDEFPPDLHRVGTLAELVRFDEVEENLLSIWVQGGARFRITATWEETDHLRMAEVEFFNDEQPTQVETSDKDMADLLREFMAHPSYPASMKQEIQWDDVRDISNRLSEFLPFPNSEKQELLEAETPRLRLVKLRALLNNY